jgi:hypothetical protein
MLSTDKADPNFILSSSPGRKGIGARVRPRGSPRAPLSNADLYHLKMLPANQWSRKGPAEVFGTLGTLAAT